MTGLAMTCEDWRYGSEVSYPSRAVGAYNHHVRRQSFPIDGCSCLAV